MPSTPIPPITTELPAGADLLTLLSPAFEAPPPSIRHRERVPPDVLRTMEATWAPGRFEERQVSVLRLRDVWVAKEGLVFDRDGALYHRTVTQHGAAEVAVAQAAVREAIARGGATPDRDGPVVLCKKRGVGNYGHWLMEMLPRAHLVHRHRPDLGARVLVADVPGQLRASMAASLALLGIDPAHAVVAGDAPRAFGELLLVEGLTDHGAYMSPLVMECVEALAAAVPPQSPRPLLVSRQSVGFRRLVDEDALLMHAMAAGGVPVEPALLPLADQIALFKGASRIAGVMGAALTNIAFAAPGTRVTALAPAGMPDTFFWFIATLRGLDYTEIRCTPSGPVRGNMPWDTDLLLDPEDAAEVLGLESREFPLPDATPVSGCVP
ncbi:glycosyltransferase family 61 protein (plasmid) [Azospirillum brasilense]|uniref:Glycosyltransferase family 61 protein n=1 Tax=Azospirillum brasilense TaxID=192 RepID=A0A4D8RFQ1_AZOBR|nr:glycosyltransferase family 61 protein [Azospirillum brasilense]QCO19964.1 glycosyltransferase family 61 protein [Azospirillum brasilense]